MTTKTYMPGCAGCDRSREQDGVQGGIIPLPGDWIVNQYQGNEGYLGWLALQPRYHCLRIHDLDDGEQGELGRNIHLLDDLLGQYWQEHFSDDPLHRVYVAYFFESIFDEPPTKFHLHLHLIPRTDRIARLLREYPDRTTGAGSPHKIDAWQTPRLTKSELFPDRYRRTGVNVEQLMTWLKAKCGAA